MAKPPAQGLANGSAAGLDKHWHLSRTDLEVEVTELEFTLQRVFAAFSRWQYECLAACAHRPLNATENVVLHVVRMRERPKTITEISRLLNRDDVANIQYAIRKLVRAGLIEKSSAGKRKGISYRATEAGERVSDEYAQLRANLLIPMVESVHQWKDQIEAAQRILGLLTGIYDSAAVTVATHREGVEE